MTPSRPTGCAASSSAYGTAACSGLAAYGDAVLALDLDVTDKDSLFAAVKRAKEHFGRLHVIVNNAGYGLFGAVEELTEQALRDQLETSLFGALWVTQAALPYLREQGSDWQDLNGRCGAVEAQGSPSAA